MRLTQKKTEEILQGFIGEEGLPLIWELYGRQNVSEFELANKTKKDIKIVRRMLYILYNHNLVGFNRKKDKQKGWYIYYWTLLPDSIRFVFLKTKRELLTRLKERLEAERRELFFVCGNNCVRLNFDQAMDFEFHCPECGELAVQDSSEQKIRELQQNIQHLGRELVELEKTTVRAAKGKRRAAGKKTADKPIKAGKSGKKRAPPGKKKSAAGRKRH